MDASRLTAILFGTAIRASDTGTSWDKDALGTLRDEQGKSR
jgi:hypothetical protein